MVKFGGKLIDGIRYSSVGVCAEGGRGCPWRCSSPPGVVFLGGAKAVQKSALPYHLSNNSYSTLGNAIIASQISIIIQKIQSCRGPRWGAW